MNLFNRESIQEYANQKKKILQHFTVYSAGLLKVLSAQQVFAARDWSRDFYVSFNARNFFT